MSSGEKPRRELPTFDGWRGMAILAVLADHWSLSGSSVLNTILGYGSRGVDLFFAISGFLICNRLLYEESHYGSVSISGFYIRRVFRIFPLFLTYLAVIALFTAVNWEAWRAALLLYRNYIPMNADWNTRHFWSLAVEEHFYLIMPFLFVAARSHRIRVFAWFAAVLCLWSVIDAHFQFFPGPEARNRSDYRMPALLTGCIAAMILSRGLSFLKRIPDPRLTIPVLLFVFLAAEILPKPERFIVQCPLFPIMILSTVLHPGSAVSRFLMWRPLALVGQVSYGLYVWQQYLLAPDSEPLMIQRLPFNLLLLALITFASFRWLETPLMSVGRRLSARAHLKQKIA